MTPTCPHCQHELTPKEIAVLYAGLRKNKRGGIPKSPERCPCGATTAARAAARGHRCEPKEVNQKA